MSFIFVTIPPGFDPWSGSVNPKQPINSPVAVLQGKKFYFCSSLPYFQNEIHIKEDWNR